nr:Sua5/YciO/YrdC/YwlC family protein [Conexibacter arvalis]
MTAADADAFSACLAGGGVAVFPTDTVYGLAARAGDEAAVARIYALKGRAPDKPAATMWFDRDVALAALEAESPLGPRLRAACEALLPGGVTLLLPDIAASAGGVPRSPAGREPDPQSPAQAPARGVRVPRLEGPLAALAVVPHAVTQSSANLAGGPDPRTVAEIPAAIRAGADLVLDAGPLPGTPSTVVDLRRYEADGSWAIVRRGAVAEAAVAAALG